MPGHLCLHIIYPTDLIIHRPPCAGTHSTVLDVKASFSMQMMLRNFPCKERRRVPTAIAADALSAFQIVLQLFNRPLGRLSFEVVRRESAQGGSVGIVS